MNKALYIGFDCFGLYFVKHFVGKGKGQHRMPLFWINAAGLEVIKGLILKLPDRRAVRAFDIVGIDFKLRQGVDLGRAAEQQVLVRLDGVGLLCILLDKDKVA